MFLSFSSDLKPYIDKITSSWAASAASKKFNIISSTVPPNDYLAEAYNSLKNPSDIDTEPGIKDVTLIYAMQLDTLTSDEKLIGTTEAWCMLFSYSTDYVFADARAWNLRPLYVADRVNYYDKVELYSRESLECIPYLEDQMNTWLAAETAPGLSGDPVPDDTFLDAVEKYSYRIHAPSLSELQVHIEKMTDDTYCFALKKWSNTSKSYFTRYSSDIEDGVLMFVDGEWQSKFTHADCIPEEWNEDPNNR